MAKKSKTKPKKGRKPANLYDIDSNLTMALGKRELKNETVYSMDFWEKTDCSYNYYIDTDRETLKGLADFINKYLDNN